MKKVSEILGKKPRKPASYDLRVKRGSKEDLEIIKTYEKALAEWNKKSDELRAKNKKKIEDLPPPEKQLLHLNKSKIIANFNDYYSAVNGVDFSEKNPYSNTDEPFLLLKTLIYYFTQDDSFFKSPVLSDLSKPSFNKGLLVIGGYGCGKTSTFKAIKRMFDTYIKFINQKNPDNKAELIDKIHFDSCVSSEVVLNYSNSKDTSYCQEIIRNLLRRTPLYIDDILREDMAYNYGKRNIFKQVLSTRADKGYKTYLTCNYLEFEEADKIKVSDTMTSLNQFRTKYDGRIYDRLFQMFNILELSGKSFRR
jgi:DNA replication protein DnaC